LKKPRGTRKRELRGKGDKLGQLFEPEMGNTSGGKDRADGKNAGIYRGQQGPRFLCLYFKPEGEL